MLNKLFRATGLVSEHELRAKLYKDFLKHEAKIGGELFGKIPEGGRREFFCLDPYTWIWYEEWTDAHNNRQSRTTRYEVRSDCIMKVRDGQSYQPITKQEAVRLFEAVKVYNRRVKSEIYQPAK